MNLAELLAEQDKKMGTYAGVRFDEETKKAFDKYLGENKIPNPISRDRLHTTLLYSRKHLPNYKPAGKLEKPMTGTPKGLVVWPSRGDKGNKPSNCLVFEYDCPELHKRHKALMKEHDAEFDYPEFKSHVTLSYDIGDLDIKKLPDIKKTVKNVNIVHEYGENLDLDWARNKGVKK